jgi:hypothetical protein
MCRILKRNSTARLGQNISSRGGIKKPRPDYNLAGPAYCRPGRNKQLTRLGRDSYSQLGWLWLSTWWAGRPFSPTGPPCPGLPPSRLGRHQRTPAWAGASLPRLGRSAARPRLGRRLLLPPGRPCPGGPASPQRPAGPDQEDPAWPGFFSRPPSASPGWAGFVYSGWAGPGFPWPMPDYLSPCRISPLWAKIYLLRDIFFIRHRLQRLVPVLGRPLAQTGTSSIVICWSWDASWLRPAYSTSPSQPYPQEEDKTDDMEVQKTTTRRRRQGLQGQSRWDMPMTMTPATVPRTVL